MKLAYLASQITLPGSPNRRSDAFEHDQMMDALRAVCKANGVSIEDPAWDNETVDWRSFDAVMIGTTWDYCDRLDEFIDHLHRINAHAPVFNPPDLVRWNSNKRYLRDLEKKGAGLIPTLWHEASENINWNEVFDGFEADQVVVKRQVGANGEGQFRLKRGEALPPTNHPIMIQPFLDTVVSEGEYSFVFVDGEISHSIIKRPADNDYRIQTTYGGTEAVAEPSGADLKTAGSIVQMIDPPPLYARVDMLRNPDGDLCLMELELIEPFLYPLQGPEFADRIFSALRKRATGGAAPH